MPFLNSASLLTSYNSCALLLSSWYCNVSWKDNISLYVLSICVLAMRLKQEMSYYQSLHKCVLAACVHGLACLKQEMNLLVTATCVLAVCGWGCY
jgi:hypothetical protein